MTVDLSARAAARAAVVWLSVAASMCACGAPRLTATPPPGAVATPTYTPLPRMAAPSATPIAARHAFHINFALDESVACGAAKCDMPYVPRMLLYWRGALQVAPDGRVTGDGTLEFTDVQPCRTLLPDVSSCQASPGAPGRFSVEGESLPGDPAKLRLTFRLQDMPALAATMTTESASGPLTIPFDSTVQHALKQVFLDAQLIDAPFEVAPLVWIGGESEAQRAASTRVFEGAYTMGKEGSAGHTYHGMGGLFFIAEEP